MGTRPGDSVNGTGFARVRGQARAHRGPRQLVKTEQHSNSHWRTGLISGCVQDFRLVCTCSASLKPVRSSGGNQTRRLGEWHRLRPCSRVNPLPQRSRQLAKTEQDCDSHRRTGIISECVQDFRLVYRYGASLKPVRFSRGNQTRRLGEWHRLRRCSRASPLPQESRRLCRR